MSKIETVFSALAFSAVIALCMIAEPLADLIYMIWRA